MSVETSNTDEPTAVEMNDQPPIVSAVVSLMAGLLAMLASAPFSGVAIPFGLLGIVSLGLGLFREGSRQWVGFGITSLFVGVLIVGALGQATPSLLLISAVGLMVSWDVGQHAVTIGEQFGRTAPTRRGEVFHAAGSTLVGVLAAGFAYGVYYLGTGEQPALAVVLLVVGTVALVWALRE